MIKKFYEYIDSKRYPTKEELEDQFLRLKEVYNCDIFYRLKDTFYDLYLYNYSADIFTSHKLTSASINLHVTLPPNFDKNRLDEIQLELESIKKRLEEPFSLIVNLLGHKLAIWTNGDGEVKRYDFAIRIEFKY